MSARHFHDKQIIPAGGRWKHYHSANFFHILSADGPLSVGFNEETPTPLHSGFERSPIGGFTCFEIKNNMTVAQEIEIICTDDKIRNGRMVVSGSINAHVVNFPDVQPVEITNQSEVDMQDRAGFVDLTGSSSFRYFGASPQAIFQPAHNLNGVRLLNFSFGNSADVVLTVGTSIPTSWADAYTNHDRIGTFKNQAATREFYIPAGFGLYIASAPSVLASAHYKVL